MKGLDLSDIEKLGKQALEDAVGAWGQYPDVDMETLRALATKAKEVRRWQKLVFCALLFAVL